MINQDDPQITAYAIGELPGNAEEIQAAAEGDPVLAEEVEAIRETAGLLREALAAQVADADLTLGAERRQMLLDQPAPGVVTTMLASTPRKRRGFRMMASVGIAACIAFTILVVFDNLKFPDLSQPTGFAAKDGANQDEASFAVSISGDSAPRRHGQELGDRQLVGTDAPTPNRAAAVDDIRNMASVQGDSPKVAAPVQVVEAKQAPKGTKPEIVEQPETLTTPEETPVFATPIAPRPPR